MRGKWTFMLLSCLLAFGSVAVARQNQKPAAQLQTASNQERERLLATGQKLFVARCAKCHNEKGDKPLATGLPLNERKLTEEEIASAVAGRLKGAPQEDKRAVAMYVSSFMSRK